MNDETNNLSFTNPVPPPPDLEFHCQQEITNLAKFLLQEFDGPTCDESACEMAIRLLREKPAPEAKASAGDWVKNAREDIVELFDILQEGANWDNIEQIIAKHAAEAQEQRIATLTQDMEIKLEQIAALRARVNILEKELAYEHGRHHETHIRAEKAEQQNKALRDALEGAKIVLTKSAKSS